MATILQENLASEIIKAKGKKNKKELLVSAGYGLTTAEASPGRTIQQKGVKKELAKYGLTDKLITTSLVKDIKDNPGKRVPELKLGADILGLRENDKKNLPFAIGIKTIIINRPNGNSNNQSSS